MENMGVAGEDKIVPRFVEVRDLLYLEIAIVSKEFMSDFVKMKGLAK